MTTPPFSLRIAVALVRTWTRVYTTGLPAAVRERRIAEIESDLWEHCHDSPDPAADSLPIVGRLVCGVPDDLGWRLTCGVDLHAARWVLATILGLAILTSSIWVVLANRNLMLPHPPAPPDLLTRPANYPPPPPPPPPPCNPPGIGRPPITPCTRY